MVALRAAQPGAWLLAGGGGAAGSAGRRAKASRIGR
ncbi:hypothetical protein MHL32_16565 [Roseomonas mucosa]|nr:hypothetical protein [Roseomonas mucosa]MCG7353292.1 hypothetical protein [Roseomonas mucosa]